MSRFQEEFFGKTETRHDELVMKCVSGVGIEKIIKAVCGTQDEQTNTSIDYETEVICQSHGYKSNFIVGYADIVIKITSSGAKRVETDAEERVKKLIKDFHVPEPEARRSVRKYYNMDAVEGTKILIECKPELKDIGTTIRQLKTYEGILRGNCINWFKAIATYSKVSDETVAYLMHEKIHVITFGENE